VTIQHRQNKIKNYQITYSNKHISTGDLSARAQKLAKSQHIPII